MSNLIKVYMGTVTAGGTDGTEVSMETELTPIESGGIVVPASGYEEGSWIKLAVRCESGYETVENAGVYATISIEDSTGVDKWQLALDNSGTPDTPEDWGDPLDIVAQVDDTNTIFWARARVAHTETPANDTSVDFHVAARIGVA